ncbi:hypothetical protein GOP47_0009034 [Adiantum capillus-veneris]|uniref:Uncharacterized protein n=1 Tax=Adiantum capillus-veneris TaxID=13818 RepID=A0A9D4UZR0_ADICA|nr:hypothetical protein GOP47_0009034 [Adiantum capillus-veneris]
MLVSVSTCCMCVCVCVRERERERERESIFYCAIHHKNILFKNKLEESMYSVFNTTKTKTTGKAICYLELLDFNYRATNYQTNYQHRRAMDCHQVIRLGGTNKLSEIHDDGELYWELNWCGKQLCNH